LFIIIIFSDLWGGARSQEAVAGEVIFPLLHDILFERIKANHTHKNNFVSKKMASFQHLTLEVHLPRVLRPAACRCMLTM
jgi:hypothetical protein